MGTPLFGIHNFYWTFIDFHEILILYLIGGKVSGIAVLNG